MATLYVGDKHRVISDPHQWKVQVLSGQAKDGTDEWTAVSYHVDLNKAVNSLKEYLLRTSSAEGVKEIYAEVEAIEAQVTAALS